MTTTIEKRPTLPEGLNIEHWNQWLEDLRTTDKRQTTKVIAQKPYGSDEELAYCCLGIGCLSAGLTPVRAGLEEGSEDHLFENWGFDGFTVLASSRFLDWLGIVEDGEVTSRDVRVAWPEGDFYVNRPEDGLNTYEDDIGSAAALNDSAGLTFSQIADVLEYFGTWGAT